MEEVQSCRHVQQGHGLCECDPRSYSGHFLGLGNVLVDCEYGEWQGNGQCPRALLFVLPQNCGWSFES